ncbi:MAG: hypothetical protein EBR06_06475 [Acidimicrobiia bacterium]|nr:hypothetical protein [Acidimicrobiia bacterium]
MGKLLAEAIGTFWLVLGGCGSAVLAAAYPDLGIGFVGVSLAFGLTVLTMAAAVGHVSGCHLNPAVTAGLVAGGRFPVKDALGYVVAQMLGGLAGAGVLRQIDTVLVVHTQSRHIPDAEETEIVMVRRGFCPHEYRTTTHRFLHHREAKHFAIKLGTASRIAHVEHRVIQTANAWHGRKATGLVMCQSLVSASQ